MPIGLVMPWSQVAVAGLPGPTSNAATELAILSLRRWCGSLTLSSPDQASHVNGLIAWLGGLLFLAMAVAWLQGPGRAIRQLFDLPGHFRLIGRATARVRQSARLVIALLGSTVLAWTVSQYFRYASQAGLDGLILLRHSRSTVDLAIDQGLLAAITPFRDVCGLADNFPLLVAAIVLTLQRSAVRWDAPSRLAMGSRNAVRPVSRWSTLGAASAALYLLYRIGCLVLGSDLPIGGVVIFEAILVPSLMLIADGLLLAWVLVELRSISLGAPSGTDVAGAVALLPGAALTCLLLLPARYAAVAVWLLAGHAPAFVTESGLGTLLQGSGLIVLQAVALVFFGMAGGLAWSRRGAGPTARGYVRLCRAEGGRVLAVAVLATAACGAVSAAPYLLLFSLPASSWLLNAADSYAHFATLPIALLALAALVDLRERTLPLAREKPSKTVGVEIMSESKSRNV